MQSLAEDLVSSGAITRLGIVYAGPGCTDECLELGGIDFFTVAQSRLVAVTGLGVQAEEKRTFRQFNRIVERYRPDLIHIHGTERSYGAIKSRLGVRVPVIVSLQGLMGECARYAWGDKTFRDVLKLVNGWELIHNFPTLRQRARFARQAQLEKRIIASVDAVLGRTQWDRSYSRAIAPNVPYFHVDEMLRSEFYRAVWSLHGARHFRLYTTARLNFLKGMHVLLEAVALLRREFAGLEVRVAGGMDPSPACAFMTQMTADLGIKDAVVFLGWLPPGRIVEELLSAHCYVNTSFIENSSNSIQEAMLLGCPCVAAFTGGNPSLIDHRLSGLLVPNGCAHLFADVIREVLMDDLLCQTIGANARARGIVRNDRTAILHQLLAAYCHFVGPKRITI